MPLPLPLFPSSTTTRSPQSWPSIETLSFTSLDWLINEMDTLTRATDPQPGRVKRMAMGLGMLGAISAATAAATGMPWLSLLLYVLTNVLYTYIAPLVARAGQLAWLGGYLLLFGLAALAGIAITGALVDRHLHRPIIGSTLGFIAAAVIFSRPANTPLLVLGLLLWGIAFGGAPTLFQTETARRAGDSADIAQSMVATAWNLAIAGGGLLGGMALQWAGSAALAWTTLPLLGAALWLALAQRRQFSASGPHNGG